MESGLPVTFAGFLNQTEITRAYAAADCLVLPSDYGETWGLAVNEAMVTAPETLGDDPYGEGWLFRLQPGNAGDLDTMMDSEAYAGFLEAEDH